MRNFTIYLATFLCLFANKLLAQDSFEARTKAVAEKIERITKEEKAALKLEVESVNMQLQNGSITNAEADERKLRLAEARAKSIEARVEEAEAELNQLVKDKVAGKIKEQDSTARYSLSLNFPVSFEDRKAAAKKLDSTRSESRTTSQGVVAAGFNNLVTNNSIAHSDFYYLRSVFLEWGATLNTRLIPNSNLLHLKYGLTGVYNMLTATENRYFVEEGNQTVLETAPVNLRKRDTYFKNVFITVPVHIEFDFGKSKTPGVFKTHQGFRMGFGGFVGYNTNSKQFLSYKDEAGHRINERQKGNWNVNDWNYGLSAYMGYKETSLYVKYDLNPMFKDNVVKQNNISLGIRFDLN